ncbi:MAG: hypothetical protein NVS3B5_23320 [Sphingomicrobium sp.]
MVDFDCPVSLAASLRLNMAVPFVPVIYVERARNALTPTYRFIALTAWRGAVAGGLLWLKARAGALQQ